MTTYQIQCHLKYKIVQPTEFIFYSSGRPSSRSEYSRRTAHHEYAGQVA